RPTARRSRARRFASKPELSGKTGWGGCAYILPGITRAAATWRRKFTQIISRFGRRVKKSAANLEKRRYVNLYTPDLLSSEFEVMFPIRSFTSSKKTQGVHIATS
ncbi:MAG TPA: hypothetical protein VG839_05555, partial [Asticcacaulis sp.]|nr:hypothetical protein [Asticcacaulis sp.]